MKTRYYIFCLLLVIGSTGCRDKISYDLLTNNHSEQKLYECKIEELYGHAVWAGSNPGKGGGTLGITVPVPDKITITWKSIRPGKEEELAQYERELERIGDEWRKATENFTKHVPYPSIKEPEGIFNNHKVILQMNGIVPKKPKGGEIIITYTGNEQFDVQYIEKK